jgi:thiosulfate/3-mercaptopyruvate sulfurtransferase
MEVVIQMIISQEKVALQLDSPDWIMIDCRFELAQPHLGREQYEQDHIRGAFYLDLEQDLSGEKKIHGGRHPLPDLGQFSLLIGMLGIDRTSHVVAYDDQAGANASRLWWMLQLLGHEQVYVMDQGYQAWKHAGRPISQAWPSAVPRLFSPKVNRKMLVSYDEVISKLNQSGVVLVDSRDESRYLGIADPIDHIPGHIPGAQHFFWKNVLQEDGSWKSVEQHIADFESLYSANEIIVYCGSGVTACPNVLAMKRAGLDQVKLYSGSWSDWVSYTESPIEKGKPASQ